MLKCPRIDFKNSNFSVTNKEHGQPFLKVLWSKQETETYAVTAPSIFQVSLLQIKERLEDFSLAHLLPQTIELYYFGKYLPEPFKKFSAFHCKEQQSNETMRLLVNESFLQDPANFKRKLSHEIFHYISNKHKKNLPTWLEEGLAILFENKVTGIEDLSWATIHLTQSPWMPLEPNQTLITYEDKASFYGQAHLFVRFLERFERADSLFLKVLTHPSSAPSDIFSDFNEAFTAFSLAKYINQLDYLGQSIEERERFILIDGVETNQHSPPRIFGRYSSSLFRLNEGLSYWFLTQEDIKISKEPFKGGRRLYILY